MKEFLIHAFRLFLFTSIVYTIISIGGALESVIPELRHAYDAFVIGVGITIGYKILEG